MEEQQKRVYYCSYQGCASYFDRPYRLAQHFLAHNNIRPFPCNQPNCFKAYTSKSHLDRHIITVHMPHENDVVYSCPQCLKSFANRQNLKRHLNTVHLHSFTCNVCNMQFKKKNQLSTHMYQHTGLKAFKCDLCTDTFVSLYLKKRHMRYHKTYKCDECDLVFNHWSKYQKHKKTDHDKNDLPQHIKTWQSLVDTKVTVVQPQHSLWACVGAELQLLQSPSASSAAKEYICNECQRIFTKRSHIVKHVKIHGQKPLSRTFPCPYENCQRFYSRKSNLKQHVLVKHMKMYHECHICNAQLSTKAKLNYHVQLHDKEVVARKPKTNADRKPRIDEGSLKSSTALKLAGLTEPPEETSSTPSSPVNMSIKTEYIEVEVDVHI